MSDILDEIELRAKIELAKLETVSILLLEPKVVSIRLIYQRLRQNY